MLAAWLLASVLESAACGNIVAHNGSCVPFLASGYAEGCCLLHEGQRMGGVCAAGHCTSIGCPWWAACMSGLCCTVVG
jgi:hypothetical protein